MLLHEHDQLKFRILDVVIIFIIYACYGITITIEHFVYGRSPYPFMLHLSPIYLVLVAIGGFGLMVLGYMIQIGLLNIKEKYVNKNKVIDEENKGILSKE